MIGQNDTLASSGNLKPLALGVYQKRGGFSEQPGFLEARIQLRVAKSTFSILQATAQAPTPPVDTLHPRMKTFAPVIALLAVCVATTHATTTQYFIGGTFTRKSVAPDACNVPDNCSFKCAATYQLSVSGTTLTATPATLNFGSDCQCYTLTATISSDTTASGTLGGNTYVLQTTSAGISVAATVDGATCVAQYSGSTATKETSSTTSSVTSVQTFSIAAAAAAAGALGFAL